MEGAIASSLTKVRDESGSQTAMRAGVDEKESVVPHGQHAAFIFYFGIIVGFDKLYSGTVAPSKLERASKLKRSEDTVYTKNMYYYY